MAVFLSPQQRALLDAILDRLIPAAGNAWRRTGWRR